MISNEESIKTLKILMSKYKKIDEMNNFDHQLALVIDYTELSAIDTLLKVYEELKENKPKPDCAEPIERTEEMVNITWVNYNYVSKDKIKAKINQIDNEFSIKILSNEKMSLDLININTQRHDAMKLVLEELLEKE